MLGSGVRLLAILLPLAVLVLVFVAGLEHASDEPQTGPAAAPAVTASPEHGGVRWVGHDWIEVEPGTEAESRKRSRRETFGLDTRAAGSACLDANCRACLIDLVYGREF